MIRRKLTAARRALREAAREAEGVEFDAEERFLLEYTMRELEEHLTLIRLGLMDDWSGAELAEAVHALVNDQRRRASQPTPT